MNERIQKLAEQAGLTFVNAITDDNEDIECVADTNGGLPCSTELEKFAELIVRECADLFVDQKYMILNPHEPFANERVRALKQHDKDTVKKIKQHFGVEE